MAYASSLSTSLSTQFHCGQFKQASFPLHNRTTKLTLPRHELSRSSTLTFSRRQKNRPSLTSKKNSKQKLSRKNAGEDDDGDLDEDAFEALFRQLEEDLKNDDASLDGADDEISEEDLAMLERELEEAIGDDDLAIFESSADNIEGEDNVDVQSDEEDDDDMEKPVELKSWQLRRLASALKIGRRKTSIKNLAAELCLDRAIVLELLRDPPPKLLLMSATLPDEPANNLVVPETKPTDAVPDLPIAVAAEPQTKVKEPLHVMQQRWSAQKRLKKVQVQTLERVYRRSKRPTNAMISSIVQVTSLPRKKILKWFEDKRAEDGLPNERTPYRRPVPETVSYN